MFVSMDPPDPPDRPDAGKIDEDSSSDDNARRKRKINPRKKIGRRRRFKHVKRRSASSSASSSKADISSSALLSDSSRPISSCSASVMLFLTTDFAVISGYYFCPNTFVRFRWREVMSLLYVPFRHWICPQEAIYPFLPGTDRY